MSQTKVQLIAPIGVVTASTLETTGVLTATTFVGDIAGTVTGITSTTDNLNLGIITATSFAGDFTGIGSGLTGTPNVVAGVVTATKFVGNTPGTVSGIADGTNINAGIITATSFVGNLTGNAAGLSTTTGHANLGIVTATSFHGSGANLEGVSSGPVSQQAVTADGSTTTIDLSDGNVIYMTQSANTTVSFANTEGNTDVVYLIRTKDDNTTERTITWPSGFVWNGGTAPTLSNSANAGDAQVFKLTTRDNGATWYAGEVANNDNSTTYSLFGWGHNSYGSIGLNNVTKYSSPTQIPGNWIKIHQPGTVVADSTKGAPLFAVKGTSGQLWAMGYNEYGNCAQNTNHNTIWGYSSPVQIPGNNWAVVRGSRKYHTVATKTDGTLWSWGYNSRGQLGIGIEGTPAARSSPVQVLGGGTTWGITDDKLTAGSELTLAIKTDGTLWTWGINNGGQLGDNSNTDRSSPVQVGSDTTWSKLSRGGGGMGQFGIKTDGTLWGWGWNDQGQLGINDRTSRSSPTQVPGTTWTHVRHGGNSCNFGFKTDGTLWAWGYPVAGQLGLNTPIQKSSPTQIPGTTWSDLVSTSYSSIATKTDGTLWAWGINDYGKLGQNSQPGTTGVTVSSPIQIPGTWATISCAGNGTFFGTKS